MSEEDPPGDEQAAARYTGVSGAPVDQLERWSQVLIDFREWCVQHGLNFRHEMMLMCEDRMGGLRMELVWEYEENTWLARSAKYGFQRKPLHWVIKKHGPVFVLTGNADLGCPLAWGEKHPDLASAKASAQKREDILIEAWEAKKGQRAKPSVAGDLVAALGRVVDGIAATDLVLHDDPPPPEPVVPPKLPKGLRPIAEAVCAMKVGQWFQWKDAPPQLGKMSAKLTAVLGPWLAAAKGETEANFVVRDSVRGVIVHRTR